MFFDVLFRLLLWFLGLRLRWHSRHDAAFRALLRGQDFTLLVSTFDGAVARASRCIDGRVTSVPPGLRAPAFTLSFLDSRYAVKTLLGTRRDPSLLMTGIQECKVRFEGDIQKFMVYLQALQQLAPKSGAA